MNKLILCEGATDAILLRGNPYLVSEGLPCDVVGGVGGVWAVVEKKEAQQFWDAAYCNQRWSESGGI